MESYGEKDHVHLLLNYQPKLSVPSSVNSLKAVSSRMIRKKNDRKNLCGDTLSHINSALCSDGFAVGAILPRPEERGLPRYLVKLASQKSVRVKLACDKFAFINLAFARQALVQSMF